MSDRVQLVAAYALAAVLTVLATWLWTAQDDINRLRQQGRAVNG